MGICKVAVVTISVGEFRRLLFDKRGSVGKVLLAEKYGAEMVMGLSTGKGIDFTCEAILC